MSTMTLEQARDLLDIALATQVGSRVTIHATRARQARDALSAHLAQPAQNKEYCPCMREDCPKCYAQPAQAVDVGAIREVIAEMRAFRYATPPNWDHLDNFADELTRAIASPAPDKEG